MTTEYKELILKEEDLSQFRCTSRYYKNSIPWQPFIYTDGVKYVAEVGEAYWILDLIGSWQSEQVVKDDTMLQKIQFWNLTVNENSNAEMICERDSGDVAVRQKICYTDFPLRKIQFYLQNMWCYWRFESSAPRRNRDYGVLLLPSEY